MRSADPHAPDSCCRWLPALVSVNLGHLHLGGQQQLRRGELAGYFINPLVSVALGVFVSARHCDDCNGSPWGSPPWRSACSPSRSAALDPH